MVSQNMVTAPVLVAEMLAAVDEEMRQVLNSNGPSNNPYFTMLHYHMGWVDADGRPLKENTGKRIRPQLCLLVCMAAGGDWRQAVPAAAAIELLHNFSLIHDDIEDASPTRRGRPTVWQLWQVPQAINAGDAMFAYAHLALSRLAERGVPPDRVVRALRRFDETCVELTQGQHADIAFETREQVSVEEYIAMITGKTAVLVALCAELGALVAGRDDETVAHYATFGRDLGLAFQVLDDILGIWGDEALIGKSAASDIETRKKTLPVLYGLAQSEALRALYTNPVNEGTFVKQVVRELDQVESRTYAERQAGEYSTSALSHLEAAEPVEPGYRFLQQLASKLLNRQA